VHLENELDTSPRWLGRLYNTKQCVGESGNAKDY